MHALRESASGAQRPAHLRVRRIMMSVSLKDGPLLRARWCNGYVLRGGASFLTQKKQGLRSDLGWVVNATMRMGQHACSALGGAQSLHPERSLTHSNPAHHPPRVTLGIRGLFFDEHTECSLRGFSDPG